MKQLIIALILLSAIPIVQAINITCSSSAICSGDNLIRINDCYANSEQFYVNESIICPDGCDSISGRCNPPININPGELVPVTNMSCSDPNTLKVEENAVLCVGSSCKWKNTTSYIHCDYGCYDNVNERGAECSPSPFNLLVYTMIIFIIFMALISYFMKTKKKKGGRRW